MNYDDRVFIVTREVYHPLNRSYVPDADMEVFTTQELADDCIKRELDGADDIKVYPVITTKEFPRHVTVYRNKNGQAKKLVMTTRPLYNK